MDNEKEGMTLGQWVLAIVIGITIGISAPAWLVWAFFLGTRGHDR